MNEPRRSGDASAPNRTPPPSRTAFLLAQLGAHAAARFADRTAALDLTPAQAGLIRLVAREPGRSQQVIAADLGVAPSRVVSLIDDLQDRDLIERRRSTTDRRNHEIHLTTSGKRTLEQLRRLAGQHEEELTAALNSTERQRLADLLQRVADQQGLHPGVHPGYSTLPAAREDRGGKTARRRRPA